MPFLINIVTLPDKNEHILYMINTFVIHIQELVWNHIQEVQSLKNSRNSESEHESCTEVTKAVNILTECQKLGKQHFLTQPSLVTRDSFTVNLIPLLSLVSSYPFKFLLLRQKTPALVDQMPPLTARTKSTEH